MAMEVCCGQCHGRLLVEKPNVIVACPHCGVHLSIPSLENGLPTPPPPIPAIPEHHDSTSAKLPLFTPQSDNQREINPLLNPSSDAHQQGVPDHLPQRAEIPIDPAQRQTSHAETIVALGGLKVSPPPPLPLRPKVEKSAEPISSIFHEEIIPPTETTEFGWRSQPSLSLADAPSPAADSIEPQPEIRQQDRPLQSTECGSNALVNETQPPHSEDLVSQRENDKPILIPSHDAYQPAVPAEVGEGEESSRPSSPPLPTPPLLPSPDGPDFSWMLGTTDPSTSDAPSFGQPNMEFSLGSLAGGGEITGQTEPLTEPPDQPVLFPWGNSIAQEPVGHIPADQTDADTLNFSLSFDENPSGQPVSDRTEPASTLNLAVGSNADSFPSFQTDHANPQITLPGFGLEPASEFESSNREELVLSPVVEIGNDHFPDGEAHSKQNSLRLLLLIVGTYASLATIYIIYMSLFGRAHQLESLPDLKTVQQRGGRAVVPGPENQLPPGHELKLGQTGQYGDIRVTPLRVTFGPIAFLHGDDVTRLRMPSDPVLKLWLKFENISTRRSITPLDTTLMFFRRRLDDREATYNVIFKESERKQKKGRFFYIFDGMNPDSEWLMVGQHTNEPLAPGATFETFIPSEVGIEDFTGEIVWRVHLRKGYGPKTGNGVTTLIDVRFNSDDIQPDAA